MATSRFTLRAEAAAPEIRADLFGTNLLFNRDSLDGTFADKVVALNIGHVRFPGGTLAEDYFSLTDPDLTPPQRTPADPPGLTDYLAWSAARGFAPNLILPNKRYLEMPDLGEAELRRFVADLAAGTWGPVQDMIIEIGNEYYVETPAGEAISAIDYARVAAVQVQVLADLMPGARIAVQLGKGAADNAAIAGYLRDAGLIDHVDLLVTHQFFLNGSSAPRRMDEMRAAVDVWSDAGADAGVYVSAWNVASSEHSFNDGRYDYGHKQVAAMVEFLTEAIAAGVSMAAVWPLQNNNKTMLTGNEGNPAIFASGRVYGLMAQYLPGLGYDGKETVARGVTVHQFSDADSGARLFLVSARDVADGAQPVSFRLGGAYNDGFVLSSTRVVQTGDRDTPLPRQPEGAHAVRDDVAAITSSRGAFTVDDVASFDTLFLRVAGPSGSGEFTGTAAADYIRTGDGADVASGGSGDDVILGLRGADTLDGGDGADLLLGGPGRDHLVGGDGNDTLTGAKDHDRLYGDAGHDDLKGGAGNDRLFGGAGDDTLSGGSGHDTLAPGSGADILRGGSGADTFVFVSGDWSPDAPVLARIEDFNPRSGDDLDFSGFDFRPDIDGHQTGAFVGTAGFSAAGQVRWNAIDQRLEVSLQGSGVDAFVEMPRADLRQFSADWF